MLETGHLSKALSGFYSDPQNGWFTPITEVIKGLSAEQAAYIPAGGFNSVWAVLNHVWFCQRSVLRKLQFQSADHLVVTEETDWPPIGDLADTNAWQAACERANAVNQELAQVIAGLIDKNLSQAVEKENEQVWWLIHGVIAHNSYHACEMISIRHMQGLWLEEV